MSVSNLHHVAIRVQDPDRSRRFYEDVLGLEFMELPVGEAITGIWRAPRRRARCSRRKRARRS